MVGCYKVLMPSEQVKNYFEMAEDMKHLANSLVTSFRHTFVGFVENDVVFVAEQKKLCEIHRLL